MCRLCEGSYDFRGVAIREDKHRGAFIVFPGSLYGRTDEDRFKFCPECGCKLDPIRFREERHNV